MLPGLIDGLKVRGYSLVGLDEIELADPEMWPDVYDEATNEEAAG